MAQNNDTYSSTMQNSKTKVLGQASLIKLVLLCLVSLILCAVGPLVIFSPIPLALAFLIYGFTKTFSVSALSIFGSMGLSFVPKFAIFSNYAVMMLLVTVVAFLVSTIIVRNEHPVKGFIIRGLVALTCVGILFAVANMVSTESLVNVFEKQLLDTTNMMKLGEDYKTLLKTGGDEARQVEQFFNAPLELIRPLYSWVFSLVFVLVFFVLWLSTFTVMRNKSIWQNMHEYKYSLSDFVNFKVPEFFTYFVILGFGLFLSADYAQMKILEVVGGNILLMLAVLYFFQGMGIYLELLKYLKIRGLLRNLLTIMTIFYGYQIVTIAGLFDTWVNFRKYFVKKIN